MTDDKHVDRYVRITNRERFLIVRGLSLLADACDDLGIAYDEEGRMTPCMKELIALAQSFSEAHWKKEYPLYLSKVKAVEENDDE